MASLLQSSRDQFCNLHMGLQGGIYDGWDNRFFYRTTSDDPPGVGSICTAPLVRNPTCGAQERSIDVSLSADLEGYELDCQRRRSQAIYRYELFCSDSARKKA